jgi:hypothetical protein
MSGTADERNGGLPEIRLHPEALEEISAWFADELDSAREHLDDVSIVILDGSQLSHQGSADGIAPDLPEERRMPTDRRVWTGPEGVDARTVPIVDDTGQIGVLLLYGRDGAVPGNHVASTAAALASALGPQLRLLGAYLDVEREIGQVEDELRAVPATTAERS